MLTLSFLKTLLMCGALSWIAGERMSPEGVQLTICLIFAAVLGAGLVLIYGEFQRLVSPRPALAFA